MPSEFRVRMISFAQFFPWQYREENVVYPHRLRINPFPGGTVIALSCVRFIFFSPGRREDAERHGTASHSSLWRARPIRLIAVR